MPPPAKHSCRCPWPSTTWIALISLIFVILIMAVAQQYGDSLPDYPAGCSPLLDLGFMVIPQIGPGGTWLTSSAFSSIADVWVIISYIVFFFYVGVFIPRPMLVTRRFFWVMFYNFFIRTLVIALTRYPRLPFKMENFETSNILWGALLVLTGVKSTSTDMMFSGHTLGWITTASFISRYTFYSSLFSVFFWVFNVLGILSLIALREHYTADIVVAIFIAKFVFWTYHLLLDSEYILFVRPGLNLVSLNPHPEPILLPAKIIDRRGKTTQIEIYPTSPDSLVISSATTVRVLDRLKKEYIRGINMWAYIRVWAKFKVYAFFKWLDNE